MTNFTPPINFRDLYDHFNASVTDVDCGRMCAPHNPSGKPFCCDICQAVPVAYQKEWNYLQQNTDLWHAWRGDECTVEPADPAELRDQAPEHVILLACKGPALCQRDFRATSCRQFPFFPYVTSHYRFIGLAYDWEFEAKCWVINNLNRVTETYRREFIQTYDQMFALWQDDFESYYDLSEDTREHFALVKRRIPLLHRNGGYYLVSPKSERLQPVTPDRFKQYGPYADLKGESLESH